MNCPICNTKLHHWDDYMDFTLMEEAYSCPDGCGRYAKYFITGYHEVGVNASDHWEVFQWSYTTSADEVKAIKAEIEAAIVMAKKENKNVQSKS